MPFFNVWEKVPFTDDKYLEAVENRPSNRAVTHHSNVSSRPLPAGAHHIGVGPAFPGGPLINAIPVREDGSQLTDLTEDVPEEAVANTDTTVGVLGTSYSFYAPGTGALRFKPGMVKIMRSDEYITWNLHYNATGRPEKDRHSLRVWFAKDQATVLQVGMARPTTIIFSKGRNSSGATYSGRTFRRMPRTTGSRASRRSRATP
jgi:hypothetical protein